MAMDRFRLIAEVQKRPALWDFRSLERSRLKITDLWREVASCVGPDGNLTKKSHIIISF